MKSKPLLFGAGIALFALEAMGAPVMELAAFTASGLCIGYLAKHWQGNIPQPAAALITDEDLRHEILDRERRIQIKLNTAYRNISRFMTAALQQVMQNAQTTDHHKLYAAASHAFEEMNPPFTLVHDFVLVEVIRYCVKHHCIPSPLPAEWGEYAAQLAQIQQNIRSTTILPDVSSNVLTFEPDVSSNVSATERNVSGNVSGYEAANVVSLSQQLPLLVAMSELKQELGDKAKPAYALYSDWCGALSSELLKVREGRSWVKAQDKTLTVKQVDVLLKTFKLKAVKDDLLTNNPEYTGKPPHPEYIVKQRLQSNTANQ